MTNRVRRPRRLLALLLGGGLGLLLAETALRIVEAVAAPQRLAASQALTGAQRGLPPGAEATLAQIVRAAKNPSIVYELIPGLDVTFQGVRVTTNDDGFRGPQRPRTKPPDGFRIVGLGDSVLFGWGVPFERCGLAVLERRLQAALPGRAVEAIDTGVPGYNTAMQEHVLRDKGLAFAPDVVLVDFVGNDFDLPDFLWARPDPWTLRRSYLLDLLRRVLRRRDRTLDGPLVWSPYDATGARYEHQVERVPPAYRHLVGPEAYRRALAAIVALGREHGFRVLVTGHHALRPEAIAVCEQLGVPIATPVLRLQQWLRDHGGLDYLGSPLTLSATDPHPSPLLHEMWADAALERMQELDWLPR
ncbi:MAG: hypothetical protein KF830_03855 [Planctomycetes bacterium]|nr:hypothetical protein [Planctomycetota bacterium]